MNQRRVRPMGRQVYGRAAGLSRPERRRRPMPSLSPLQQRLLLLVVVVGLAAWGLTRAFATKHITVEAAGRGGEITTEARHLVDASWQQQNLLTFDGGELESRLQQADPFIRSLEVRRKWPQGIMVSAVLKQPSLGWSSGNQRYLLDHDGTAIGSFPADSKLPVVTDGSNLPVELGKRIVSARFVDFVTAVVPALAAGGVGVSTLSVGDTTYDLTVMTNKGYRLIFDTAGTVGDEINDLRAVMGLLASQKKAPTEYIDLRTPGKAYYK